MSHILYSDSRLLKCSNSKMKPLGTETNKGKCGDECWQAEEAVCPRLKVGDTQGFLYCKYFQNAGNG